MSYPSYLVHFNPYHNPKNGQFAPAKNGKIYGRLDRMSDGDLYKGLRKEIRSTKKEKWGWSNQWMSQIPIGPKSEALIYDREQKEKAYKNTPEYKAWLKKVRAFNTRAENGKIDDDEYDDKWEKLMKEAPDRNFNTLHFVGTPDRYGLKFFDDFSKNGGRDLSIAYLEDMGYDTKKAEEYVDRLAKHDWSLGGY